MKNYISWRTIFFQRQEHYINFNSTHRVHWSGSDLKVFNSIYLALTSQYFLPIISENNEY